MKTNTRRLFSLMICSVMILNSSVFAMAKASDGTDHKLQGNLAEEETSTETIADILEIEGEAMYLEENAKYRIVYIAHNEGHISYSVC